MTPLQSLWYLYAGFVCTTSILFINTFVYPWASLEAMRWTSTMLTFVQTVDLLYVGHVHIHQKDYAIILHHVALIVFGLIFMIFIDNQYTDSLYQFLYWILMQEISTWFNQIRLMIPSKTYPIARNTVDTVFGIVFLTVRSLSSFMCLYVLLVYSTTLPYWSSAATMWYIFTVINYHWGSQIVRKGLGYPRNQLIDSTIPLWRWALFYTGFALPLIYAY
jgi:hypothetical protein